MEQKTTGSSNTLQRSHFEYQFSLQQILQWKRGARSFSKLWLINPVHRGSWTPLLRRFSQAEAQIACFHRYSRCWRPRIKRLNCFSPVTQNERETVLVYLSESGPYRWHVYSWPPARSTSILRLCSMCSFRKTLLIRSHNSSQIEKIIIEPGLWRTSGIVSEVTEPEAWNGNYQVNCSFTYCPKVLQSWEILNITLMKRNTNLF